MVEKSTKKVVRVQSAPVTQSTSGTGEQWKPTGQAKGQATTFRLIAALLWLIALGGEAFAIFWVLKQNPINMVLLIGILVGIGVFAVGGSLLWKRANVFDPASTSEPVRFFVQNQLGAIITVIAFVPLIILIFLNKDMSGKQKGVAGGAAIVLLLVAGYFGISFNPPSVEQNTAAAASAAATSVPDDPQYAAEQAVVVKDTGQDLVFWTKSGTVYHLCQAASAVNETSKDNTIYSGTVTDAHVANKTRLTLQVQEELHQCGFDSPSPSPSK